MATFIKIAAVSVGSGGTAAMDFTSIPSTYTDLCIKISTRDSDWVVLFKFNNDATSQTMRELVGTGNSAASTSPSTLRIFTSGSATTQDFGNSEIYIPNYTSSNFKSVMADGVGEVNAATAYMGLGAGLWSNTAAINRVTITANAGGNIPQYSTATLYGIKNS
jgi:hypothetical protein